MKKNENKAYAKRVFMGPDIFAFLCYLFVLPALL